MNAALGERRPDGRRLDRAAAERHHRRVLRTEQLANECGLGDPKLGLALLGEELREPKLHAALEQTVGIDDRTGEACGDVLGQRRLARAHEPDQRQMPAESVQRSHHSMRSRYAVCAATKSRERVAAELVPRRRGELEGHRGLGDDSQCFDSRDVRALDERRSRLAGGQVDRGERLHQRRQRLHRRAHDDLLAVRDAGLDPTGMVRVAPAIGTDLVVGL